MKTSADENAIKAWDDVYAVKILTKEKGGILKSPYRKKSKWKLGKQKTAVKFDAATRGSAVNIGFHCYRNINQAMAGVRYHNDRGAFLVKIPKGAMYYENNTEICANKMVIMHEIKKPKK